MVSPGGFGSLLLAGAHPELLRTLVLLEPPAFPLLGVNIPPQPAQAIKLLIRHPRAGLGFLKFGATGMRPAIKAFDRGDDPDGLRALMAANTSKAAVDGMSEAMFRRFVDNVGPLKAQIRSIQALATVSVAGRSAIGQCRAAGQFRPQDGCLDLSAGSGSPRRRHTLDDVTLLLEQGRAVLGPA